MNIEQFEMYRTKNIKKPYLDAMKDFGDKFYGTLLYGNLSEDGDMIHVYVENGLIHKLRYYRKEGRYVKESHEKKAKVSFEELIEDGRFYPEACSWNLIHKFIEAHIKINFATFSTSAPLLEEGTFYPLTWKA